MSCTNGRSYVVRQGDVHHILVADWPCLIEAGEHVLMTYAQPTSRVIDCSDTGAWSCKSDCACTTGVRVHMLRPGPHPASGTARYHKWVYTCQVDVIHRHDCPVGRLLGHLFEGCASERIHAHGQRHGMHSSEREHHARAQRVTQLVGPQLIAPTILYGRPMLWLDVARTFSLETGHEAEDGLAVLASTAGRVQSVSWLEQAGQWCKCDRIDNILLLCVSAIEGGGIHSHPMRDCGHVILLLALQVTPQSHIPRQDNPCASTYV
jgi:hypothetical protein